MGLYSSFLQIVVLEEAQTFTGEGTSYMFYLNVLCICTINLRAPKKNFGPRHCIGVACKVPVNL